MGLTVPVIITPITAQRPRLSRLADLAGFLPQTIVLGFKAVENTNEDT
jgi:hypothetical protein